MNDLSQKVLAEIREKKISPIPRWAFSTKNYAIWFVYVFFLFLGGLASAVVAYLVKNNDWDIYHHLYDGFFQFILLTAPYFWLVALAFLTLAAEYNFRRVKGGYRYHAYLVALASILISLALGAVFYHYGLEQIMHNIFVKGLPFYNGLIIQPKEARWTQPDSGVLAGRVILAADSDNFILRDFSGGVWDVSIVKTHIRGGVNLLLNTQVKVIGAKTAEGKFEAQEIRPWLRACSDCSPAIQQKIR